MYLRASLLFAAFQGIVGYGQAEASTNVSQQSVEPLDDFISRQTPIALQGILNNIGPYGINAWGASEGVVIASPSKSDPDYFFTWTRDAALVMRLIINAYAEADGYDHSLETIVEDYVSSQAIIQTTQNPSGSLLSNGDGLGEAKYQVDYNAFTEPWGRPQHDGPALRTIALITYAQRLLYENKKYFVLSTVWPIIQNDLAYISRHWNETGFDLWEEVKGSSVFTTAAQYHALVEGNSLAEQLGQTCYHCTSQYPQVLCLLQSYWSEDDNHVVSNINTEWDTGRTGKDASSILASLVLYDPLSTCDENTFQPCSARALANHKAVVDSFRSLYPLNADIPSNSGVAVGRYAEDVYMGGNPWYIATHAAAEQLYAAMYQFDHIGVIYITSLSLPFFQSLPLPPTTPELVEESIPWGTPLYATLKTAILEYADSFLSVSQAYTPDTGLLAEQFDRENGLPRSAESLTWSYASFLTAVGRRSYTFPTVSWSQPPLPDRCPPLSPPDPVPTFKSPCQTQAQSTLLQFAIQHPSPLPESAELYITGGHPSLASWDTSQAVPLSLTTTSQNIPIWNATIRAGFPPNEEIEYKYIQKNGDGEVVWESDPNRRYTVPPSCDGMVVGVYDTWR